MRFFDEEVRLSDLGERPPLSPAETEAIREVLALTGHELANTVDYNDPATMARLEAMSLLPPFPRRSLAQFVIDGWRGRLG